LTNDYYGVLYSEYRYLDGMEYTVVLGPEGVQTLTVADEAGLVTAVNALDTDTPATLVDGLGNVWLSWYNQFGQVTQTQAPDGATDVYARNGSGWITGFTDARNFTTAYTVNADGEDLSEDDPDGSSASWTYQRPPPDHSRLLSDVLAWSAVPVVPVEAVTHSSRRRRTAAKSQSRPALKARCPAPSMTTRRRGNPP
jgi:YD repeat-containing protein